MWQTRQKRWGPAPVWHPPPFFFSSLSVFSWGTGRVEGGRAIKPEEEGEEEENSGKKPTFSAWVVFLSEIQKVQNTMGSFFVSPPCCVCVGGGVVCVFVNVHGGLVRGGLLFTQCPAVDVFGIVASGPSIIPSPQWLLVTASEPSTAACNFVSLFYFFFIQPISQRVKTHTEIMLDTSPALTTTTSPDRNLPSSWVTSVSLAPRPWGTKHG